MTSCCVLCVYCAACCVYYVCALCQRRVCLWVGVGTKVGVFMFGVCICIDLNNILTSIILYCFIPARISLPFTGVL